jgi:hypothetical protein
MSVTIPIGDYVRLQNTIAELTSRNSELKKKNKDIRFRYTCLQERYDLEEQAYHSELTQRRALQKEIKSLLEKLTRQQ